MLYPFISIVIYCYIHCHLSYMTNDNGYHLLSLHVLYIMNIQVDIYGYMNHFTLYEHTIQYIVYIDIGASLFALLIVDSKGIRSMLYDTINGILK